MQLLRRETFIALRARQEGYRIASEILHPPIASDLAPYEPKTPIDPALPPLVASRLRAAPPKLSSVLLALAFVFAAVAFLIVSLTHG
jgi:hypothetical protein